MSVLQCHHVAAEAAAMEAPSFPIGQWMSLSSVLLDDSHGLGSPSVQTDMCDSAGKLDSQRSVDALPKRKVRQNVEQQLLVPCEQLLLFELESVE